MRKVIAGFGIIAGAIVVALVSRYGYATSDTPTDGAIAAFFFAVIATGGIAGPAVATHLFRNGARFSGLMVGLVSIVALLANLSNSLGAIVGRADKTIAERTRVTDARKDDRAELTRLIREREALPAFVPTDAAAVAAARTAADTARRHREAECDKRGPLCRQRELDEQAAATRLSDLTRAKAAADRAASLDAAIEAVRARLASTPAIASANPLADTLGRIFQMPAETAATWQQVATVVVVELLIVFSLLAAEMWPAPDNAAQKEDAPAPAQPSTPLVATNPEPFQTAIEPPAREVMLTPREETGNVGRFMLACLPRTKASEAAVADIYARYIRWCSEQSPAVAPLSVHDFAMEFARLCRRLGIRTRKKDGKTYCLDVTIIAA